MLTNVHMLGTQRSAKHPANTSPLTALGCPGLLSKDSLYIKPAFVEVPVRQNHHLQRARGIWRRDVGVGGELDTERERKCLGGGEGQGN